MTALAVRPDGTLVAGTTPGGRVYSVDPKNGKSKLLATLTAEHVWALALDGKSGTVYAGTGGPGKISAIETGGRTRTVWDSGDKHVVSLLAADDKHLFAGHLRGGDPLQGRARRPRRGARRLRRRGGARAGALRRLALRGGQRLRALVGERGGWADRARRRAEGHQDHRRAVGIAGVGGIAAAPGPAQGQGRALPPRRRRAHGADVLDPRRLLHDAGVRRRRPRLRRHRQRGPRLSHRRPTAPPRWRSTCRSGRRWRCCAPATDSWSAPATSAASTAPCPRRRRRRPTCRACSTASTGRAGVCSAGTARTTSTIESRSGNTAKPDTTWTGFAALEKPRPTAEGGVGQVASPPARYVQYRATLRRPRRAAGRRDRSPTCRRTSARASPSSARPTAARRRPRSARWGRSPRPRRRRRRRARTRT